MLLYKSVSIIFRQELEVTQTAGFGKFMFGKTAVVYTATDPSGNTAKCTIHITLQSKSYNQNIDRNSKN